MKQKDVFKKIGGIIEELSDQYEYLKTVNDDLNDLELELFAANAHFLTDHIEILCKLNLQKEPEKKPVEKKAEVKQPFAEKPEPAPTNYEQKFFEPVVQQMKHDDEEAPKKNEELFKPIVFDLAAREEEDTPAPTIDIASVAPTDEYSYTRQEPEPKSEESGTIRHELIIDDSINLDDDEKQDEHEIEIPEPEIESGRGSRKKKAEPETFVAIQAEEITPPAPETIERVTSERIDATDEIQTINEKMSQQLKEKGMSRTDQIAIKPISDIKLAITLNDKLLYVKDLFNGYNLAYSEAIEILNRFNTFEEAARFLKTNYVSKNNWDSKPATVEKFYALLRRRYA